MRAILLTKENEDYSRLVSGWIDDFSRHTGKNIEIFDLNTVEGDALAKLYDIVDYPAILALDDSGEMLDSWVGKDMPRFDEVSFYAQGE